MTDTETIRLADETLDLLDQTRLPGEVIRYRCRTVGQAHDAIRRLVVRGAPAIGIAAAYAVTLARDPQGRRTRKAYLQATEFLATSRPTAVNLFWALDRIRGVIESTVADDELADDELAEQTLLPERILAEARKIHDEDRAMCQAIGRNGAPRLASARRILTHCNAGGLATSMWGTALAPLYHLHREGKRFEVYADETRPLLQGGRLTAWELAQAGIPVTVITDSMAGSLMRAGRIDAVIVGADRIAANGDVANKIGTYPLAVLARHHEIPFYVAIPSSSFDRSLSGGDEIPIEGRAREEVSRWGERTVVPDAAGVLNPAFDVTPADLVTAIISERGVVDRPGADSLRQHFA